ncbi:MAG: SpoIIE family protein phosphatase [Bacteroidetes bacterium]|nr:SpoIIE family protein phosphatase [Bacteroidota bacterium]
MIWILFSVLILSAGFAVLIIYLLKKGRVSAFETDNLRNIIEQANDAVMVIDITDGKIHYANGKLAEMLGYPVDKITTITIFDLHPKESMERCSTAIADAWEKKGLIYQDIPLVTSAGEYLPVECSAKVAPYAGRPSLVVYARDIRDRLKMENEIRQKNEIIERKNRDMLDSIHYAKKIQQSILPADDEFFKMFPDSFVLFRPRDIVSGDFYWTAPLNPPEGGKSASAQAVSADSQLPPSGGGGAVLLCVADCTGHGVPGAFMSMLCTALLNETVNNQGITAPEKIFEEIRKSIVAALRQKGEAGEARDGMDAAIIKLGARNGKVEIAAANNPVYIVRPGQAGVIEIPADRFPVGFQDGPEGSIEPPFTHHETDVRKGDMIYLITDGYKDQFGSQNGKKFKSRRLKELLVTIHSKPVAWQKDILEKTFDEWKGSSEQTDDVTVIGIRI